MRHVLFLTASLVLASINEKVIATERRRSRGRHNCIDPRVVLEDVTSSAIVSMLFDISSCHEYRLDLIFYRRGATRYTMTASVQIQPEVDKILNKMAWTLLDGWLSTMAVK